MFYNKTTFNTCLQIIIVFFLFKYSYMYITYFIYINILVFILFLMQFTYYITAIYISCYIFQKPIVLIINPYDDWIKISPSKFYNNYYKLKYIYHGINYILIYFFIKKLKQLTYILHWRLNIYFFLYYEIKKYIFQLGLSLFILWILGIPKRLLFLLISFGYFGFTINYPDVIINILNNRLAKCYLIWLDNNFVFNAKTSVPKTRILIVEKKNVIKETILYKKISNKIHQISSIFDSNNKHEVLDKPKTLTQQLSNYPFNPSTSTNTAIKNSTLKKIHNKEQSTNTILTEQNIQYRPYIYEITTSEQWDFIRQNNIQYISLKETKFMASIYNEHRILVENQYSNRLRQYLFQTQCSSLWADEFNKNNLTRNEVIQAFFPSEKILKTPLQPTTTGFYTSGLRSAADNFIFQSWEQTIQNSTINNEYWDKIKSLNLVSTIEKIYLEHIPNIKNSFIIGNFKKTHAEIKSHPTLYNLYKYKIAEINFNTSQKKMYDVNASIQATTDGYKLATNPIFYKNTNPYNNIILPNFKIQAKKPYSILVAHSDTSPMFQKSKLSINIIKNEFSALEKIEICQAYWKINFPCDEFLKLNKLLPFVSKNCQNTFMINQTTEDKNLFIVDIKSIIDSIINIIINHNVYSYKSKSSIIQVISESLRLNDEVTNFIGDEVDIQKINKCLNEIIDVLNNYELFNAPLSYRIFINDLINCHRVFDDCLPHQWIIDSSAPIDMAAKTDIEDIINLYPTRPTFNTDSILFD